MPHQPTTTHDQQIKELERELQMRKDVYPRWIGLNRIAASTADYRIRLMTDILDRLQKMGDPSQLNLFDQPAEVPEDKTP